MKGLKPGIYSLHNATWQLCLINDDQCYPKRLYIAPALSDKIRALQDSWNSNEQGGQPVFTLGHDFVYDGDTAMLPLPAYHLAELKTTAGRAIFQSWASDQAFRFDNRDDFRIAVLKILERATELLDNLRECDTDAEAWDAQHG